MVQKASQKEAFSPFIIEELPDIVRRHEVWVEHSIQKITPGNPVFFDLCFGHTMQSDKAVKIEKVTPSIFGPWGKDQAIEISAKEGHLQLRFSPAFEGYHIMGVEYDGGILDLPHPGLKGPKYYYQYTKTIFRVSELPGRYPLKNLSGRYRSKEVSGEAWSGGWARTGDHFAGLQAV